MTAVPKVELPSARDLHVHQIAGRLRPSWRAYLDVSGRLRNSVSQLALMPVPPRVQVYLQGVRVR